MFTPVKRVHLNGGYRTTTVNGSTQVINVRQVPGFAPIAGTSRLMRKSLSILRQTGSGGGSTTTTAMVRERPLGLPSRETSIAIYGRLQSITSFSGRVIWQFQIVMKEIQP